MYGFVCAALVLMACQGSPDEAAVPAGPVEAPPDPGPDLHLPPDGLTIVTGQDGQKLLEGPLRAGLREGTWTTWWDDQTRAAVHTWKQGVLDGPFQRWSQEGRLLYEGRYAKGEAVAWKNADPSRAASAATADWARFPAPVLQVFDSDRVDATKGLV